VIQETFSIDGTPDIEVRIQSGRVDVKRGAPGTVKVTVETQDPDFYVEQRGNSIVASSDRNTPWLSRGSSFVAIETPEGSDLYVGAASARVDCELALNRVEVKTASGDVEIETAETVVVKSASGDVKIGSVNKTLRLTSASGSVLIDCCRGSVNISTASGDVHIEDSEAAMNVNTVSGDIAISRLTGKTAAFKSMSGSITVGILRGSDVDLDVNLLSGRLNLPQPEPREGVPERLISIRAKSVSGDLTISRA